MNEMVIKGVINGGRKLVGSGTDVRYLNVVNGLDIHL